jgi:hypothetical protein
MKNTIGLYAGGPLMNRLREAADEIGVLVKLGYSADKDKVGIHLRYPTWADIWDALDVAERDGFKTIYIHNR